MANKEYLNVNELATLFGLNVQTLHYYDKIGILKPSYRDPKNGYRKYRFDQTYKLASIRYMRKLGYSIEAVRDFQDTKSPDEALKKTEGAFRSHSCPVGRDDADRPCDFAKNTVY